MSKKFIYTERLPDEPYAAEDRSFYQNTVAEYLNAAVKELKRRGVRKVFVQGLCDNEDINRFLEKNKDSPDMLLPVRLRDEGFEILPLEDPKLYRELVEAYAAIHEIFRKEREAGRDPSGDVPKEVRDVLTRQITYSADRLDASVAEGETALIVKGSKAGCTPRVSSKEDHAGLDSHKIIREYAEQLRRRFEERSQKTYEGILKTYSEKLEHWESLLSFAKANGIVYEALDKCVAKARPVLDDPARPPKEKADAIRALLSDVDAGKCAEKIVSARSQIDPYGQDGSGGGCDGCDDFSQSVLRGRDGDE